MKHVPQDVSNSVRKLNPHLYGGIADQKVTPPSKEVLQTFDKMLSISSGSVPAKRIRQSSKPLMNKLETEYFHYLQAMLKRQLQQEIEVRPQAKRYRLGNGIYYKPDFTAIVQGVETAWEVKGPHAFRGGFENLKVAASTWKEMRWVLVWKENGIWREQNVLP